MPYCDRCLGFILPSYRSYSLIFVKNMVRILFLLIAILLSSSKLAIAQTAQTVAESSCDRQNTQTNNRLLASPDNLTKPQLAVNVTSNTTTQSTANTETKVAVAGISKPSLWWAREQFDPFGGRLINNWLTYPQIKQIDLTVNWQLWTLLDYLGRYRFINQFGSVAREYGYSLRIFNQQKQCLARYEYNDATNPPKWEIQLEGIGEDSLQVEPENN